MFVSYQRFAPKVAVGHRQRNVWVSVLRPEKTEVRTLQPALRAYLSCTFRVLERLELQVGAVDCRVRVTSTCRAARPLGRARRCSTAATDLLRRTWKKPPKVSHRSCYVGHLNKTISPHLRRSDNLLSRSLRSYLERKKNSAVPLVKSGLSPLYLNV